MAVSVDDAGNGLSIPSGVVVVGSLHLDILVRASQRPRKGETLPGQSWNYKPGGKGGNQAVAAAQFGASVSMISRVGDDDFGVRLLEHLKSAAVDTQYVSVDAESGSGMSVAIVDAEGDYGAVIVSGANLHLSKAEVDKAELLIAKSRVLVLQNEVPEVTNLAAAILAKDHGVRVILNAAPARPLGSDMAAKVDLLIVNAVEAEMMGGVAVTSLSTASRAAAVLSDQVPAVIVTAGGLGLALAVRGEPPYTEGAHPVILLDTHGAGDAFVGALSARWASGKLLKEAVHFANAAAALFVSTPVTQKGAIASDQVMQLLSDGHR
ncbi:MAG: ribokinase [Verrucomicrobia bacterium]|nr:ribokinase [Verrucomicrobiota bacterium]